MFKYLFLPVCNSLFIVLFCLSQDSLVLFPDRDMKNLHCNTVLQTKYYVIYLYPLLFFCSFFAKVRASQPKQKDESLFCRNESAFEKNESAKEFFLSPIHFKRKTVSPRATWGKSQTETVCNEVYSLIISPMGLRRMVCMAFFTTYAPRLSNL